MKTSTIRKIIAAMMVMSLLTVALIIPSSADALPTEIKHTLDASTDLAPFEQGAKADGDTETAGTDGFFTLHYSTKTKIDGSSKTFDDGYSATQRVNMGGKTEIADSIKNAIEFTTAGAATVKVWWVAGGDGRELDLFASDNTVLHTTAEGALKNGLYISTIEITEAGKYYLGSSAGSNYYFKVESVQPVTAPAETVYALDATADLTAFAQGAKSDGDTEAAGTDGYFTLHYSAKTKIDSSSKTFDDGYAGSQRVNMGGSSSFTGTVKNAIEFTTEGAATVKIWWVAGGDGREIDLAGSDGTVLHTTAEGALKNGLYISTIEITEAGKYYIGSTVGSNYYFKVEVTETAAPEPVITSYALDATTDVTAFAQGAKSDGDTEAAGTDGFFTLYYSAKTKVDSSSKTFDDGYAGSQRVNMGGSSSFTGTVKNAIEFTTEGAATVKIWWVAGGDGREIDLAGSDGTVLQTTAEGAIKNALYISTFELADAGKYYIGSTVGSNYYFKVEVTVTTGGAPVKPPRAAWESVAAPAITGIVAEGGDLKVSATGLVGYDGGDELKVTMYDALGNEIASKRSIAEKDTHTVTFNPSASGTYTFKASLVRENETAKESESASGYFLYPLGAPNLVSATSKGAGKLEVIFTSVKEATSYEVVINGAAYEITTETTVILEGLTVGERVTVTVNAIRADESKASANSIEATITETAQQTWGFAAYGPSTNVANNGYVGSVNEDGSVTVYSEGGKGKIQPASVDGIAYYYTAVPTEYNFTLRATVTVDSWTFSNGQEGFGLMASDRIGASGNASDFWNNSYLVGSTKFEYRYESLEEGGGKVYDISDPAATSFPKYSMKQGIGVIERTGVTKDNLALFEKNDTATIQNQFLSVSKTFETTCGYYGYEAGTYNVIGGATNTPQGTLEDRFLMTTFVLEIQKNNTGYFATYYDTEGNIIAQEKFYDPAALSKLDSENVYVGFFASRNARATFSNIHFDTILASEDAPAEERPINYVQPTVSLSSPTVTTELGYTVSVDTNVNGTLKITLNGDVLVEGVAITGLVRYNLPITLPKYGDNDIIVTFTPDPEQDLGEYTELATTDNQSISAVITANKGYYHNKVIYVSPTGDYKGNGSLEYPLDIYTAVNNVIEGQTIVLLEGTYLLTAPLKIQRGMDGTADAPIKMIADPDAQTRPVLDFQGLTAGIVHGGDYWYFYGFDVTRSADMQKGFQVSGNYNVLDNIHTYYNGNTGIQISRLSGSDLFPDWPAYNLILNCTSWCNYDAGFEDADGFAAKLTVGEGNVFDGCVAYNNADDGWDLFAKVETGPIGSVTIKNCVAYANGFVPGIDGKTGNGNGFKLGGSSITGKHQLINSYAFYNLAKGIDSNSCPDVIVKDCISYNNGSYNVAFYTNAGANTDFKASGIISYKDADLINHILGLDPTKLNDYVAKGEQLKGKGTQVEADYINASTYYWYGTECKNAAGETLTAEIFKSLVFTGITRNADGTINMNGFLELVETAPDAGANPGGTASGDNSTLPEGDGHVFSDEWYTLDSEYHWHECECGFTTDRGAHEFEYVIDVMPTPTTTGWKHKECTVCGKQGARIEVYYDEFVTDDPDVDDPDVDDPDIDDPDVDDPDVDDPDGESESFFDRIMNIFKDLFRSLIDMLRGLIKKE